MALNIVYYSCSVAEYICSFESKRALHTHAYTFAQTVLSVRGKPDIWGHCLLISLSPVIYAPNHCWLYGGMLGDLLPDVTITTNIPGICVTKRNHGLSVIHIPCNGGKKCIRYSDIQYPLKDSQTCHVFYMSLLDGLPSTLYFGINILKCLYSITKQ